jgi:hypothetical protein
MFCRGRLPSMGFGYLVGLYDSKYFISIYNSMKCIIRRQRGTVRSQLTHSNHDCVYYRHTCTTQQPCGIDRPALTHTMHSSIHLMDHARASGLLPYGTAGVRVWTPRPVQRHAGPTSCTNLMVRQRRHVLY